MVTLYRLTSPNREGGRTPADTVTSTGYISTVGRGGQATLRNIFPRPLWALTFFAAAILGCTSTPTMTPGPDEFVGRPADAPRTSEGPPSRPGEMWYHIEPQNRELTVNIRLLDPPATTTFFLPGPWANHDGFDELITIDEAHGPNTQTALPMTIDRGAGRIDIETDDRDWVELSYRVGLPAGADADNPFVPWSKSDQFFAYAPTILVLPSAGIATELRDIPIEVHTPDGWTVSSTWSRERVEDIGANQQVVGFVAEDIRSLRDAYIGAGRHWNGLTAADSDRVVRLTCTTDFAFEDEQLLDAVSRITDYYVEEFSTYEEISAIAVAADDDASLGGTGRRGGFVLEIPQDHPLDDALLTLTAHEAFHMWNGHQLVPASDSRDETRWFKEGLTHYVAVKTLARHDLIDASAVRDEFARAGQYYLDNPVITGGRIRPIDRSRLPYDRGLLVALALDVALYEYTDGRLTIEDWIATLLAEPYARDARSYDPGLLRESFRAFTRQYGLGPARRYDELVSHKQTIDVRTLYRKIGLHFIETEDDGPARLLPIEGQTALFDALFHSHNHQRHGHD